MFVYYTARNSFASARICGTSADASAHKPCSHLRNDSFYPCDTNNY
jgi:hypothetical protein